MADEHRPYCYICMGEREHRPDCPRRTEDTWDPRRWERLDGNSFAWVAKGVRWTLAFVAVLVFLYGCAWTAGALIGVAARGFQWATGG